MHIYNTITKRNNINNSRSLKSELLLRRIMRETLLFIAICSIYDSTGPCPLNKSKNTKVKFNATWESLDSRPLPQWYESSKVGILVHWGLYSLCNITSLSNKFYWRNGNITFILILLLLFGTCIPSCK